MNIKSKIIYRNFNKNQHISYNVKITNHQLDEFYSHKSSYFKTVRIMDTNKRGNKIQYSLPKNRVRI